MSWPGKQGWPAQAAGRERGASERGAGGSRRRARTDPPPSPSCPSPSPAALRPPGLAGSTPAPAARPNQRATLTHSSLSPHHAVARPTVAAAATAVVAAATTAAPTPSAGPDLWNTTYYPRAGDTLKDVKTWYLVDAEGQTLGRLASSVAQLVRGKHTPAYHPSMNTGAYVVVINAEKVAVTGNKANDKLYRRHTGRPGSMKTETFKALQVRIPERIVEKAIRGMLPSGKLGNELFRQLKVYKGAAHPHEAQQPVDVTAGLGTKTAMPQKA